MMRSRGFTLLEMLIAIALFALLGVATYRMFHSILQADEKTREQQAEFRALSRGIARLDRDMLHIINRPIRDAFGDSRKALMDQQALQADQGIIEFTLQGWRNPLGLNRSELQRVRWQLTGQQLQRLYWSTLDQGTGNTPQTQRILSGVSSFEVRYRDTDGNWTPDWPPAQQAQNQTPALPVAIEVRLQHQHYGEIRRVYRLPDMPVADASSTTADTSERGTPSIPTPGQNATPNLPGSTPPMPTIAPQPAASPSNAPDTAGDAP